MPHSSKLQVFCSKKSFLPNWGSNRLVYIRILYSTELKTSNGMHASYDRHPLMLLRQMGVRARKPSRQTCGRACPGPAPPAAAAAPAPPRSWPPPHLGPCSSAVACLLGFPISMLYKGQKLPGEASRAGCRDSRQATLTKMLCSAVANAQMTNQKCEARTSPPSRPSSFCLTRSSVRLASAFAMPSPAPSCSWSSSAAAMLN